MADINAPIQQQLLYIPVAERDGVVQPNSIADDFSWEAMTDVHEPVTRRTIPSISKRYRLCHPPLNLTVPLDKINNTNSCDRSCDRTTVRWHYFST